MNRILIVAKQPEVSTALRDCFDQQYVLEQVASQAALWALPKTRRFDYLFVDVEILGETAKLEGRLQLAEAVHALRDHFPGAQVVVMTPPQLIREAVNAVRAGAADYLTYPLDQAEVAHVKEGIKQSFRVHSELQYLRDTFWREDSLELVRTNSPLMRRALDKLRSVAPTKSTALLIGETGTGKEVLAKLIHRHSHRRERPFISVHCGAIPDAQLESELFGHEKGAFTGAMRRKLGKLEIADGGSIFLDEVAAITAPAQIKLLQVLQDRTLQRLGGDKTIEVDVRIIAATNLDLAAMVREGRFRSDLFYRLNVFPIEIPSLRDRSEDVPLFAELFLTRLNKYYGKGISGINDEVMEALQQYSWPGNIRELENLVERAYILETTSTLSPEGFPSDLMDGGRPPGAKADVKLTLAQARRQGVDRLEREYLHQLLTVNKGRIKTSAAMAGITTRQLHKLMAKHVLDKADFK